MDGVGKIVEGVNALEAALNSNRVRKVFVLDKKSNKSNKFNVLIENIKKQNIAILMVEQNARQALEVSDRGYILVTGKNAYEGKGDYLLNDKDIRKAFLGG